MDFNPFKIVALRYFAGDLRYGTSLNFASNIKRILAN